MKDLIIVGAGPAGITAAIYAKRAELDTVIIDKQGIGGQIALSELIENYPGIPSISGVDLMNRFEEHAVSLGIEVERSDVTKIIKQNGHFTVRTSKVNLNSKAVIIATGAYPKKLSLDGEQKFTGRGVSYCATCDGPFFKGLDVAVAGGGDTAIKEALYLSRIARKIHIIHRRDTLRAEKINQKRLFSAKNVHFEWDSVVEDIAGETGVDSIKVRNLKTDQQKEIPVQGIFIFVGIHPSTDFVDVEKDKNNFIITDQNMGTSIKGIFAAGDCRAKRLRQVTTAVGDGATAAVVAEDYINSITG